ncbi:solute carrier family 52, riboflavin transporter, member 3 [Elysia marginata]|uniref:Riboflavin transporter n=1 Tax=Elysia marginata TaxID=1093978 RepID=A0AAV4FVL6_9GAST|nr:solute carrier family 52, riboflavin transporter, member 3 [Elysia marginata]
MEDKRDPSVLPTSYKTKSMDVFTVEGDEITDNKSGSHKDRLTVTHQIKLAIGRCFLIQVGSTSGVKSDEQGFKEHISSSNPCVRYVNTMINNIRLSLGDTKLVVHLLVIVFAIASWADMNGMWSEMPLLTLGAPEQWTLASYVIIIGQVANIGPILFVMVSYFLPSTRPQLEISVSFLVILVSMVAAFLMGYFYDHTSYIAGEERSTGLLLINFFLAVGDCTSSVCFYAYMSLMKPQYIASLLLGEGLSGFLPGMLALIQGAGEVHCVNGSSVVNHTYPNGTIYNVTEYTVYPQYEQPLFSVRVYFIVVSVMIALSAIAFVVLNKWSYCRSEFVKHRDIHVTVATAEGEGANGRRSSYGSVDEQVVHVNGGSDVASKSSNLDSCHDGVHNTYEANSSKEELQEVSFRGSGNARLRSIWKNLVYLENLSRAKFFWLLFIVLIVNITLTTFLPTVQIYTVLPYGLEYYHLTTSLVQMSNPVACFFAVFILAEQVWVISVITLLGQFIVAYLIYLAAQSPEPPLHKETGGGEIAVFSWILVTLLLIYAKVCVAGVFRKCGGRSALVWAGFITQVGTSIGAIVGFLLVNHYHLFKDAPYC